MSKQMQMGFVKSPRYQAFAVICRMQKQRGRREAVRGKICCGGEDLILRKSWERRKKIGGARRGPISQRHQTTGCTTLTRCTTLDLRCHRQRAIIRMTRSIMAATRLSLLGCAFWACRNVAALGVTSSALACYIRLETSQAWGLFPAAQCRGWISAGMSSCQMMPDAV